MEQCFATFFAPQVRDPL